MPCVLRSRALYELNCSHCGLLLICSSLGVGYFVAEINGSRVKLCISDIPLLKSYRSQMRLVCCSIDHFKFCLHRIRIIVLILFLQISFFAQYVDIFLGTEYIEAGFFRVFLNKDVSLGETPGIQLINFI